MSNNDETKQFRTERRQTNMQEWSRTKQRQMRKNRDTPTERQSPLKPIGTVRLIPIWLRLIIILLLIILSVVAGLIFGYGIIGDGNPSDALNWDTWQHLIDLVKKEG